MGARKRFPLRGLFGGLFLGVGAALMLVLYGQLLLGKNTFMVVAGALTLLGLVLGIVGVGRGYRDDDGVMAPADYSLLHTDDDDDDDGEGGDWDEAEDEDSGADGEGSEGGDDCEE